MANEDPGYLILIRGLPCRVPGCTRPSEAHHPTHLRHTGDDKRRAHDHNAIPLCRQHHVFEFHGLTGYFKGWNRAQLRRWQDEQLAAVRLVPQVLAWDIVNAGAPF